MVLNMFSQPFHKMIWNFLNMSNIKCLSRSWSKIQQNCLNLTWKRIKSAYAHSDEVSANNFLLNRSFETRLTLLFARSTPFHISENAQAWNQNTFFGVRISLFCISRTFGDTESHEIRLKIRKNGNQIPINLWYISNLETE